MLEIKRSGLGKLAGLIMIVLLSGCAPDGHFRSPDGTCWTCLNNPVTGNPLNHDGEYGGAIARETEKITRATIIGDAQINVDLAYIRIKQAFNISTKAELESSNYTSDNYKVNDRSHEHKAVPGVYYVLADSYRWGSVRFEIEKLGGIRTEITVRYDQRSKTSPKLFRDQLISKINKALKTDVAFTEKK